MTEIGTLITDLPNWRESMAVKLSDFGLAEGDLVTVEGHGLNSGGNIYRILKDSPPRSDARWGQYTDYSPRWSRKSRKEKRRDGWVDAKGYLINPTRLRGCIEVMPVFSFMAYPTGAKAGRKLISYSKIKRQVKKIDLMAMATQFASFQLFINQELRRLQGE
jgi:hypothetical protein